MYEEEFLRVECYCMLGEHFYQGEFTKRPVSGRFMNGCPIINCTECQDFERSYIEKLDDELTLGL
jgi:hypothetical protein